MIPQTVGREFDIGKVVSIQCIKDDALKNIEIKGQCFLMLIIYDGSVCFQVGSITFEAVGPCFVCFDEREEPKIVRKSGLRCDSIYFHPIFLNVNMTFEQVHSDNYEQVVLSYDMFLLKPFTDRRRYVFSLPVECRNNLKILFTRLEGELKNQYDWYWSYRSHSFFVEMMLMLERAYRIIGEDDLETFISKIKNPHLKNAVAYIENHYSENMTLESLTKAASINHSTLTRLFKDELGVTPIEYLWLYRITVAKKLLKFTMLPIKDIAVRCGFKTVQHFSRKFEAYTNDTPTAFRNMAVARRKDEF